MKSNKLKIFELFKGATENGARLKVSGLLYRGAARLARTDVIIIYSKTAAADPGQVHITRTRSKGEHPAPLYNTLIEALESWAHDYNNMVEQANNSARAST